MKKLSKATKKKFDNYKKNSIHRYNYFDNYTTLGITINNNTKGTLSIPLFGSVDDNTHFHKYIKVDNDVEYSSVLKTLLSRNLYIGKLRITSSNTTQVCQCITEFSKNIYGQSLSNPLYASSWLSPYQPRIDFVENDHTLIIGNDVSFRVPVLANTSVRFDFYESKLFEFKYKIGELLNRSNFYAHIDRLLTDADYIVRQFNKNPYLHENKGMDLYCNEIKYKIYNWINDKSFELTLHKNLIEIFDKLSPFIQEYKKNSL